MLQFKMNNLQSSKSKFNECASCSALIACLLPLRAIQRVCNGKKIEQSSSEKTIWVFLLEKIWPISTFFMMIRKYNFFFKDLSLLNELTQHTPLLSCCRFYLEKFDQWQICVSCLLTFEKNIVAFKNSKYYLFTRLMKCINKEQLKKCYYI